MVLYKGSASVEQQMCKSSRVYGTGRHLAIIVFIPLRDVMDPEIMLLQLLEILLLLYVTYLLMCKRNGQQQQTAPATDQQICLPTDDSHEPIQETLDGSNQKTVVL